jgi:hypothetical protein
MPGFTTMAKYLKRSCRKCHGYLRIVIPERKAKMPVQAINVRCLKCGYRLAWVLVEENGSGTKRRRFPFHATPMRFFSGWFSEHLSGSAGDSAQRGEGNCLLEAGVVAFGLGFYSSL